ncbi:MAG: ComF family protein [Nitrospiria bacterium]
MFSNVNRSIPSLQDLLNLIYPRICLQCGDSINGTGGRVVTDRERTVPHDFCPPCWGTIHRLDGPRCPICAVPLASEAALSHSPDHRCGECRERPPAFSHAITPFVYEGALAKAIHLLKYQKQIRIAGHLVQLFINDLLLLKVDRVMAIPLHPRRLRDREFNQSLLLADRVSRLLSIPLLIDAMQRVRETPPQVGLSKKARKKNIHRAFKVVGPESVRDQRILLIDDVYTTGATLKEGAKTLIRNGAKEVVVATPARMVSI